MTQYIAPNLAMAMQYSNQQGMSPSNVYSSGQLALANGGLASLPRHRYQDGSIGGGIIQGTPMSGGRTGYGFFKKLKKRVKKLIPKELAGVMQVAAPFVAPHSLIGAAALSGLGQYKSRGKISPWQMAMSMAPGVKGRHLSSLGLNQAGNFGANESVIRNLMNRSNVGSSLDKTLFGTKGAPFTETVKSPSGLFPDWELAQKGLDTPGWLGEGGKYNFGDLLKKGTEAVFMTGKGGDRKLDKKALMALGFFGMSYAEAKKQMKLLGKGDLEEDHGITEGDWEQIDWSETFKDSSYLPQSFATGGRAGYRFGTLGKGIAGIQKIFGEEENQFSGGQEGDIGFEAAEEISEHPGTLTEGDIGESGQPLGPYQHEGAQAQDPSQLRLVLETISKLAPGIDVFRVIEVAKLMNVGIEQAIEIVKNQFGGEEIIEEETATLPDNWMERLPPKKLWPQPNVPDRWPEEEKPQLFATGGRAGLQWGSDKGEGLGGEEVEADMRYEGGFMPYGEEPKADDVPARLSKDEFVFTDQAVAGAGDGDVNLGAERLYAVMKNLEQGGPLSQESQGIGGLI